MKRLAYFLLFLLAPVIAYAYTVGTPSNMVPANWAAYAVDPGASDSGATSTAYVTLKNLIDSIGASKKATIIFPHTGSGNTTGYTIATALDMSGNSNIMFQVEQGAQFKVSDGVSGITFPSPANIKAQPNQQILASGNSMFFSLPGVMYQEWYGAAGSGTTQYYLQTSSGVSNAIWQSGTSIFITMPSGTTGMVIGSEGIYIFDVSGTTRLTKK